MAKITIRWNEYNHPYPVITQTDYVQCKAGEKSLPIIEDSFFKLFGIKTIIIGIGILSLFSNSYGIGGLFIIVSIFIAPKYFLSLHSYLESYYSRNQYLKSLTEILYYSDSYESFCMVMSDIDKRYVIQLNREQ